ncbi:MAG: LD-carboxypeptidase [Terriglobales bacterium]|jgi:muramoyltetrapeptide carboxypeptidase
MGQPTANHRIKPPALMPGDTVGIVAPASPIQRNLLDAGSLALFRMGYKPFFLDSIFEQDLYFAGSVKRRARELEEMFRRTEVKAIICARGGYGCNYLLEEFDLNVVRENPKIFVGYSDVTTLLTWFTDVTKLVTFHGPMITRDFDDAADLLHVPSWKSALEGKSQWEIAAVPGSGIEPVVTGDAEGTLYGGCLSMLAASVGTPFAVRTDDTILFIEDIGAKPFQVDRMLMQMKLAGKFSAVRGIVFGEMLNCVQQHDQGYKLQEVIKRVLGDLGIPIAYGLRSGHVSKQNITLPIGVRAKLHVADSVRLSILENSVVAMAPHAAAKS